MPVCGTRYRKSWMILSAVIRNKRFGNHGREHAEFEFAAARYGARLRDKTTSLLTNFSTFTKVARAKIIQALISWPESMSRNGYGLRRCGSHFTFQTRRS